MWWWAVSVGCDAYDVNNLNDNPVNVLRFLSSLFDFLIFSSVDYAEHLRTENSMKTYHTVQLSDQRNKGRNIDKKKKEICPLSSLRFF